MKLLVEAIVEQKQENEPLIFCFDTSEVHEEIDKILLYSWKINLEKIKKIIDKTGYDIEEIKAWLLQSEKLLVTILQLWLLRELEKKWDLISNDSDIKIKEITQIWWVA